MDFITCVNTTDDTGFLKLQDMLCHTNYGSWAYFVGGKELGFDFFFGRTPSFRRH